MTLFLNFGVVWYFRKHSCITLFTTKSFKTLIELEKISIDQHLDFLLYSNLLFLCYVERWFFRIGYRCRQPITFSMWKVMMKMVEKTFAHVEVRTMGEKQKSKNLTSNCRMMECMLNRLYFHHISSLFLGVPAVLFSSDLIWSGKKLLIMLQNRFKLRFIVSGFSCFLEHFPSIFYKNLKSI